MVRKFIDTPCRRYRELSGICSPEGTKLGLRRGCDASNSIFKVWMVNFTHKYVHTGIIREYPTRPGTTVLDQEAKKPETKVTVQCCALRVRPKLQVRHGEYTVTLRSDDPHAIFLEYISPPPFQGGRLP